MGLVVLVGLVVTVGLAVLVVRVLVGKVVGREDGGRKGTQWRNRTLSEREGIR